MTWVLAAPWLLVMLLVLYRYVTRRPRLRDYQPLTTGPLVSVIIPARNEARNIERCVKSVLATAYAPIEVIVVDDRSTDGTAELVEPATGRRLHLIRGTDPPAGWFGKQWAIMQGYLAATGELLLFADADTRHERELIGRAVAALQAERADLFTVLPRQEMRTFWERVIQPHVMLALEAGVAPLGSVNRTRIDWHGIANGQFILTPRAAYESAGTHGGVRDTVVDDLALAQAYVRAGKDIFLVHAEEYMTTRMYGSLREIVAGWSKNLASGVPRMMPPIRIVRATVPYLMWLPSLFWILPPVAWALHWPFGAVATLIALATWLAIYAIHRVPPWYALLYPLGAAFVAFIMLRSALRGRRI
ncbi:MAG TPA: glycosyltransferase family 2 protein, partial [Gemmatimonadales bacterium]|nr:glycosyltransferase family 2 protein [Gemmatimonadales bacterium]